MRIRIPFASLFALSLCLAPTLLEASAREFDLGPAPVWVDRLPVDAADDVPRAGARYGTYSLLNDHQVRVQGNHTSEYFRRVRKVVSSSGVQHASELTFDFDPSYQRLILHDVAVLRGPARIGQLESDEVRVIEKEAESESKIFDGLLTAMVFLKDVRPGDAIDYSWSLEGANSLLDGRYADDYPLSSPIPARILRHRLLWPAGRPLHYRSSISGFEPRITPHGTGPGGENELVWQRANVPALEVEDETPDSFDPFDSVQLSEFSSWSEVAGWANRLFGLDSDSTTAVQSLASRIRNEQHTRSAQILAAIRFVQDDIRYLGIELGRSSHEPHPPSLTISKRWGDCKDKALLLAALLRELGVEAYPALVNTRARRELDHRLPSPFLFDHVITQVIDGDRTYWIDGTLADQGGALETIETPDDERALVVRPETTALSTTVTSQKGSTIIEHTYSSRDYESAVTLEVRSMYSGGDADEMRAWLATRSTADLARERLNRIAADQPKVKPSRAPLINDDRFRNVIVIREGYQVRDLWKNDQWTYYPREIERRLRRPETMIRAMPLAFPFPLDLTERLVFHLPEHLDIRNASNHAQSPAFRYDSNIAGEGTTLTVTHHLHATRDSLSVAEVPDHLATINEIGDRLGYSFGPGTDLSAAGDLRRTFRGVPGWVWGALALTVPAGVLFYLAVGRRKKLATRERVTRGVPAERGTFRAGEAAASAIEARNPDEMTKIVDSMSCWCGAPVHAPADIQQARYGDGALTIVSRHCAACGREQSIYFSIGTPQPAGI